MSSPSTDSLDYADFQPWERRYKSHAFSLEMTPDPFSGYPVLGHGVDLQPKTGLYFAQIKYTRAYYS